MDGWATHGAFEVNDETISLMREAITTAKSAGRVQAYVEILQMLTEWEKDAISNREALLPYQLRNVMRRVIALRGDPVPEKNQVNPAISSDTN